MTSLSDYLDEMAEKSNHEAYVEWIRSNALERGIESACDDTTHRMMKAFPELKRVRGFVTYPGHQVNPLHFLTSPFASDGIQHWWCVAPDGTIVDPTAGQFPSSELSYEEYDETEHGTCPEGKCMDCGELFYDSATSPFCSESCDESFRLSLM